MSDENSSESRKFTNERANHHTPLVSKEEWIKAGLFVKLAPDLCKELHVSMQYVADARMKHRGDPDFPVGQPYSIHAVKFHTMDDYLAAGVFDKPIAQVAREMGVGPDAVAAARARIRMNPPPGIDPELLKPKTRGHDVRIRERRFAESQRKSNGVARPLNPHPSTPITTSGKRGPKPQIVDREQLLRALLTSYNWVGVMKKLSISREVFLRSVKFHGFEADAERIKGYIKG